MHWITRWAPALCMALLLLAGACDDSPSSPARTAPTGPGQLRIYAAAPLPLMILDTVLPVGVTGQAYSHQMTAMGGSGAYVWSIVGGAGAAMVNISTTGELTFPGMPTHAFGTNLFIRVTDSTGTHVDRQINIHANLTYTLPAYSSPATTYILHCGDHMALVEQGFPLSRFQRAVRALMRDISGLVWDSIEKREFAEFAVILAGNHAAQLLRPTIFTAEINEKIAAINLLATLTPGGQTPMFSAALLAETTVNAFASPERLCLYSGAGFGADAAAPGGQADYANVMAEFSSWATTLETEAFDFAPVSSHLVFMQNFSALGVSGAYSAPQ